VTTKTTGAEWQAYMDDPKAWPDGAWLDDCQTMANGVEFDCPSEIAPDAKVTISGGLYWPRQPREYEPFECTPLELHFKRWRKAQTVERLIVEVPKEKAALFREAMRRHGGKEIK